MVVVVEYYSSCVGVSWAYGIHYYLRVVNCIYESLYGGCRKDSYMRGVVTKLSLQLLSCWLSITFASSKRRWHYSYGDLVQLWNL